MPKICLSIFFIFLATATFSQTDESSIRKILDDQVKSWDSGSIDDFMKGYWQNDSLVFIRQDGASYGYENALNGYKKRYNTAAKMGKLFFTLLQIKKLSPEYYFVIGKWLLKRNIGGDVGGTYSLLFRKIKSKWVIVADHTS